MNDAAREEHDIQRLGCEVEVLDVALIDLDAIREAALSSALEGGSALLPAQRDAAKHAARVTSQVEQNATPAAADVEDLFLRGDGEQLPDAGELALLGRFQVLTRVAQPLFFASS
jgi:hypothetical protein